MIRVIHHTADFEGAVARKGLLEDIQLIRDRHGVLEAEAFQSLATTDDDLAVTLLLDSEENFSDLLRDLTDYPSYSHLVINGENEMYVRRSYTLIDGAWAPEVGATSRVVWPSAGPVSIYIHGAYEPNEWMHELTAKEISETRREPGCLYYTWFENLELENHLLLLELWQNQKLYDNHWFGRMKTTDYRGDSGRQSRTPLRGEAAREFYRQQRFEFHYGRMLPAAPSDYSETVIWTAR